MGDALDELPASNHGRFPGPLAVSYLEYLFDKLPQWETWHDPDPGQPIAAPLEPCAELLGVDLATVREVAANVEPYIRADGTKIWSLMQLERQLRPN